MQSKKFWSIIIFVLLLTWLSFLMANKIDLTTADLGRHLQNGKWIVENHFNIFEKNSPLFENFYSYTNQNFPAVNHHWGAGVIFYGLYKWIGFFGLSIFYIFLSIATFSIFFYVAKRESNFTTAVMFSFLLLPLIAERREVRPEIFSYFFASVFLWVLWKWQKRELAASRLYVLPFLMIFWVNLHIYFFLGLFLIGVFWFVEIGQLVLSKLSDEEFSEKAAHVKNLSLVLFLSVLASLVSPFGLEVLLYPFQIFKNYGYTIVENKSVWFVENYGIVNSNFLLIKAVLILLALSFSLLFAIRRKKISIHYFIFAIFFGAMGWFAIRNFTLLGFFALPILASNFESIFTPSRKDNSPAKENGLAIAYIAAVMFAIFINYQFTSLHASKRGIGLLSGNKTAAEFIQSENIKGPFFNNYDIGGYLIWSLPAKEKVFVDNRPEAYPDSFFSEIYKPMQENPAIFEKVDQEYNFNAIVFSQNDITPWGTNFLKVIKENPNWAQVFEDNYAVVYLKRNNKNEPIIQKYPAAAGPRQGS